MYFIVSGHAPASGAVMRVTAWDAVFELDKLNCEPPGNGQDTASYWYQTIQLEPESQKTVESYH